MFEVDYIRFAKYQLLLPRESWALRETKDMAPSIISINNKTELKTNCIEVHISQKLVSDVGVSLYLVQIGVLAIFFLHELSMSSHLNNLPSLHAPSKINIVGMSFSISVVCQTLTLFCPHVL